MRTGNAGRVINAGSDNLDPIDTNSKSRKQSNKVVEAAGQQTIGWIEDGWQGNAEELIGILKSEQVAIGFPPSDPDPTDSRKILAKTIGYLSNNTDRMNHPRYRKLLQAIDCRFFLDFCIALTKGVHATMETGILRVERYTEVLVTTLIYRTANMPYYAHSLEDRPKTDWETMAEHVRKHAYLKHLSQRKVQQMLHLSIAGKQKKFLVRNSVSIHAAREGRDNNSVHSPAVAKQYFIVYGGASGKAKRQRFRFSIGIGIDALPSTPVLTSICSPFPLKLNECPNTTATIATAPAIATIATIATLSMCLMCIF